MSNLDEAMNVWVSVLSRTNGGGVRVLNAAGTQHSP